jgi:hypothetical protein
MEPWESAAIRYRFKIDHARRVLTGLVARTSAEAAAVLAQPNSQRHQGGPEHHRVQADRPRRPPTPRPARSPLPRGKRGVAREHITGRDEST